MTFEAVLRIIKAIAENCNYMNLLHRLARIWSLRSGLEFLNLGDSRWDQCIVVLIAEGKEFHYSLDGKVLELAPADQQSCIGVNTWFLKQVYLTHFWYASRVCRS